MEWEKLLSKKTRVARELQADCQDKYPISDFEKDYKSIISSAAFRRLQDVAKCPYCLLNTPNTLDHYFDKSDYPDYSVYTPNLVPCCSIFNLSFLNIQYQIVIEKAQNY